MEGFTIYTLTRLEKVINSYNITQAKIDEEGEEIRKIIANDVIEVIGTGYSTSLLRNFIEEVINNYLEKGSNKWIPISTIIKYLEETEEDTDLIYRIAKLSQQLCLLRTKSNNPFIDNNLSIIGDIKIKVIPLLQEGYSESINDVISLIHYYIIEDTLNTADFRERVRKLLDGDKRAVVTYNELWNAMRLKDEINRLYSCLQSFRGVPEEISILSDIKREVLPILKYYYSESKIDKIRDLIYSYKGKEESRLDYFKLQAREIMESNMKEKVEDTGLCNIGRSNPLHLFMSLDKENINANLFGVNAPAGMTLVKVSYDIAIQKVEAIIDEELDGLLDIQVTNKYLEEALKMQLADLIILRLGSSFEEFMLRPLVELFYSYITNKKTDKESLKEEARNIMRTPLGVFTRRAIEKFREKDEEENIDETSETEEDDCTEDKEEYSFIDEMRKTLDKQEESERISKILTANRLIELGISRGLVFNRLDLSEDSFNDIKEHSDELLATMLYDIGFSQEKIEEILGVQGEEFEEE